MEECIPQPKVVTPLWCGHPADSFMPGCGSAPTVVGFFTGTHLNAQNSGKKR